jgi:hypothetical protein
MSGKLCNAFDMVRIHLFGLKDEEVKGSGGLGADGKPVSTNKLPSYEAMCELATKDRAVRIQIGVEKLDAAGADFADGAPIKESSVKGKEDYLEQIGGEGAEAMLGSLRSKLSVGEDGELESEEQTDIDGDADTDQDDEELEWGAGAGETELSTENMEWLADLEVDKKGNYLSTINNVVKICENDPKLKGKLIYCSFSKREMATSNLPWRRVTKNTAILTDRDESSLRHYMETRLRDYW